MITLLLVTALSLPPQTGVLVLRSGQTITIDGAITETNGRVVFRAKGGTLYSLPVDEIDADATRAASLASPPARDDGKKKLKVSADERNRLLRDLENNHTGTPAPPEQILTTPPPAPTKAEEDAQKQEEWRWRRDSRAHEDAVRRAKENLTLLVEKVERLQGEIRGLVGLGFKPNQFSYQAAQLQSTLDQIPYAQLDVTRAQRELEEFREDARKQGIMPGWLR
jgi:hypothetical protein